MGVVKRNMRSLDYSSYDGLSKAWLRVGTINGPCFTRGPGGSQFLTIYCTHEGQDSMFQCLGQKSVRFRV